MKRISNKELVEQLRRTVYLLATGTRNSGTVGMLIDELERRLCPQPSEKPAREKQ